MIQELPKFHETFNPILDILSNGETVHHRELLKRVVEKYYKDLPQDLLDQKTNSGEVLILNRIAWGKSYLKKGGYIIYPERGMVRITDKGKKSLKNSLQLKDIVDGSGFMDFYADEQSKGISVTTEIKNSTPQDLIDRGFNEIEIQVKTDLLDKLKQIDPYYFEKVILIFTTNRLS